MTQAPGEPISHAAFRDAYAAGRARVEIDPALAARFMSARLLLPLFILPVLGVGVGLALLGWIVTGLAIIAAGIVVPRLIKRSAPHFILTHALSEEAFYRDSVSEGVLRVTLTA
ncbi:MAG TPA: hypothetical protein VNT02_16505 [Burkholderiales bacterium]|nr:hypothetical protein [Burkholderiales bacterium]